MAPTKGMKKHINPQAREVIFNVCNYFQQEKDLNHVKFNLQQVLRRTSAATGCCERTITRIKKQVRSARETNTKIEVNKRPIPKSKLHRTELLAIKKIISNTYTEQKRVPTLKIVLQALKDQLQLNLGRESLRGIILRKLGYKYERCQNNKSFLIEKHELRLQRAKYLYRLKQNTALGSDAKTIVYLDETWMQQLPFTENIRKSKLKKRLYIMMNGGGRMGFIPEAKVLQIKPMEHETRCEIDPKMFELWLKSNLLQYLPTDSIVVLCNPPLKSIQMSKPFNSLSKREDLEKWLDLHKIPFDNNLLKVQLFELVKNHCPTKVYVIDSILKEHGHEVLRLPLHNYDLNPIEYMCNLIKQRVKRKDPDASESEMQKLTMKTVELLKNTDWMKEMVHVKLLEEDYWLKDLQMENEIEQISATGKDHDSDSDCDIESGSSSEFEEQDQNSPFCYEPIIDIIEDS